MLDKKEKIWYNILRIEVDRNVQHEVITYFISGTLLRYEINNIIHANTFKEY